MDGYKLEVEFDEICLFFVVTFFVVRKKTAENARLVGNYTNVTFLHVYLHFSGTSAIQTELGTVLRTTGSFQNL